MHNAVPSRTRLGQRAENAALCLLQSQGLHLVARNVRNRWGELDLIMRDGPVLVIVEVRSRSSARYGDAAATIGPAKQARLARAAITWLGKRRARLRFDVVTLDAGQACWLRHAFDISALMTSRPHR